MAYNLPMEDSPSNALRKSFTQGSNLYKMLMDTAIQKQQSKRAEDANRRAEKMQPYTIQHLLSQIENANAANKRAEGLYPFQLKTAKNKSDPDYEVNNKINMIEKLREHFGKKASNQKAVVPTSAEEAPSFIPSIFQSEQKELPKGTSENPDVIDLSEDQLKELEKNIIPEQKKDVVSEYDAAQQNQEKSNKFTPDEIALGKFIEKATGYNPYPEEKLSPFDLYVKKRQFDLENPKPSTGKTREQIDKEQALKLKELDAKIAHWKKLEENSATEEQKLQSKLKVIEAQKEKQLEVNKQKQEAVYKGQLDKEQAKLYSKMQEEGIAGIKSSPKFNDLLDIIGSDTFKSIRKHPGLPTLEMFKNKKAGTPEQQHLIGQFENITNEVIADMAKGLNPRFTNKDLELAKAMKISEKDSYQSALAKAENIVYLHELGQQRIDKALELIDKKKIRPYFAIKQADAELNSDKIRKEIRNKLHIESKKKESKNNGYEGEIRKIKDRTFEMKNGDWHEIH
jgi:hypothetical protein